MPTKRSYRAAWCVGLLVASFNFACATSPRDLETPAGPRTGDQLVPFEILGVLSRGTSTLHRSNARDAYEETFTVSIPPGTEIIVPAIRGWSMGFGRTTPEDTSNVPSLT